MILININTKLLILLYHCPQISSSQLSLGLLSAVVYWKYLSLFSLAIIYALSLFYVVRPHKSKII